MKPIRRLWKCGHCESYYPYKMWARKCCYELLDNMIRKGSDVKQLEPILYVGKIVRKDKRR